MLTSLSWIFQHLCGWNIILSGIRLDEIWWGFTADTCSEVNWVKKIKRIQLFSRTYIRYRFTHNKYIVKLYFFLADRKMFHSLFHSFITFHASCNNTFYFNNRHIKRLSETIKGLIFIVRSFKYWLENH